jgi:hypothetical protein
MPVDLVTLMAFESGQLSHDEILEMLSEMLSSGEIKTLPDKYSNLAKQYIRRGLLSSEDEII